MEPAVVRLVERYGNLPPERASVKGNAVLAAVIVNQAGCIVESPAAVISSFGWGVMTALNGQLSDLARWPEIESVLVRKLEDYLRPSETSDGEEKPGEHPLTMAMVTGAYQMLLKELGLPEEFVEPPVFAIRSFVYFKDRNPPEPLLLNSFFLRDLALARQLFAAGKAPDNLKRYLGQLPPKQQLDLLQNRSALDEAVSPTKTPVSRWPGPGRHPLVLLQQAAVNLGFSETKNGGLLGVNGPPGTGKTTLLRDVVAEVVAERAEAMIRFDDPETAFEYSNEKLKAGGGWIHMYRVAEALRGFEIVVASSNNKAVENVSAELPALSSISEDAHNLRYFKPLADAVHKRETWGMIAAVLGNAQNRHQFKQTFWWDEDLGMSRYLAAAAGTQQQIEERDPITGHVSSRMPKIVLLESPPSSRDEALERWRQARQRFLTAIEQSRQWQVWLKNVQEASNALIRLKAAEDQALRHRAATIESENAARSALQQATSDSAHADAKLRREELAWSNHLKLRPGFFSRLFRTKIAQAWKEQRTALQVSLRNAQGALNSAQSQLARLKVQSDKATEMRKTAEVALASATSSRKKAEDILEEARAKHGIQIVDDTFHAQAHGQKHRSTPWFPAAAQKCRDDVFIAAMDVHRAFLDAAAKPIRHNLGALMTVFHSQAFPNESKQALLPHLWSTLFLVVPLISTTFASVERMLGRLPPETLGWLLIDEAGQALPQAAVGALIRTRKTVVVGDPVQIEPVVVLPETLTSAICRQFGVDPDRYSAPAASVQTLADTASAFASEFQTRTGSRMVGVPLLVHRRCSEPMFGISNSVAYSGLMVNAKTPKSSRIRDVLGPSTWFHVQGSGEDKWCSEEGAQVLRLLEKLAAAKVPPELYIISPFVIVADRLRQIVRDSRILEGWVTGSDSWKWTFERIGTVHTVQGREAEAVIFVLGAPLPAQAGARNWAGNRPNLLNVAVTRAKEALYVVGNRDLWREAGLFAHLDSRLAEGL